MISPGNCEEAGQVKPSQAGHRLPGQDRKSGSLKPRTVSCWCTVNADYY